jgi:hypothetical protein
MQQGTQRGPKISLTLDLLGGCGGPLIIASASRLRDRAETRLSIPVSRSRAASRDRGSCLSGQRPRGERGGRPDSPDATIACAAGSSLRWVPTAGGR